MSKFGIPAVIALAVVYIVFHVAAVKKIVVGA